MILQSLQFILFCLQKMIFYQIVVKNSKRLSFDDIVHFIDEESFVTYVDFDCATTFYIETPTKIRQFNRERKDISRSCEKAKCIPSNDQHNCSFDDQHSSKIFVNPYKLWDVVLLNFYCFFRFRDAFE